ncbi:MAG: hypothetical protein M1274_04830 [Actinobacteria bacterium]|nr:hypothetical protein [Actinomycetota bacterium]
MPDGRSGRRLKREPPLRRFSIAIRGATAAFLAAAALVFMALASSFAGCSSEPSPAAKSGDVLQPGVVASIDLDGDAAPEAVILDKAVHSITITDGSTIYRSREKWSPVAACLGDTDGNGLPEILALLDAADGRHLGMFGYSGGDAGEYRELLVTGVLQPRPLALRVEVRPPSANLLVLTEEAAGEKRETSYRWNGFGFTALSATAP